MEIFLIIFSVAITIVCIILLVKMLITKKAVKEIDEQFEKLLDGDTNAQINISSADKDMAKLALSLNKQIKSLRSKELVYTKGDRELKSAITNVAHDIRTPLTAICGYVDMIKDEKDIDKIQRYIAIIDDRASALKNLAEELFKYSVSTDTTKVTNIEKVNIGLLLQETLFSFLGKFSQKCIIPQINICETSLERMIDKNSLTRIFSNIIDNAIKYSDGDFVVSATDNGEISFCNTASNLDNVDVEKLFDRFFTVENGRNSTGLGLSIAKLLTKQLGGEISAQFNNGILTIKLKI